MPSEDVPQFLVDELVDLDPPALRSVAAYADGESYALPDDVPESVRNALALQDDATLAAVAAVARDFAESAENGESVAPGDDGPTDALGGRFEGADGRGDAAEDDGEGEDWWEERFL
jgi:hypothetical protein